MRSRRSSKKELAETLAAIAVVLSFEFAAPAIALAVGTIGVGDIIAAATFAAGVTQGLGFWSYVGGCGYTFYSAATNIGAALHNQYFWACTIGTAALL